VVALDGGPAARLSLAIVMLIGAGRRSRYVVAGSAGGRSSR